MQLIRIGNKEHKDFLKAWELYERNFIKEERRDLEEQLKLFNEKEYYFNLMHYQNEFVGIALFWENEQFIFFEHLVVAENHRCKGYATQVFNLLKNKNKQIIFEIELPTDQWKKTRLNSFKKLGFVENEYEYYQFQYRKEDKKIPMIIMSHKNKLSQNEYDCFINYLKGKVYPKF